MVKSSKIDKKNRRVSANTRHERLGVTMDTLSKKIIVSSGGYVKDEGVSILAQHKLTAIDIQRTLASLYQGQKGERIRQCGNFLTMRNWLDKERTSQLVSANFCKHSLCPLCSWRRHIVLSEVFTSTLKLAASEGYQLYHLVLTIPNTKTIAREALISLKQESVAFIREHMRCKDYILSLEITNKERGFHPHTHCIIAYPKDVRIPMIVTDSRLLKSLWGKVHDRQWMMAKCDPITDSKKAAMEVGKYVSKLECSSDQLKFVLDKMTNALQGVRRVSSGGWLREVIKDVKEELKSNRQEKQHWLNRYDYTDNYYRWVNECYVVYDSSVCCQGGTAERPLTTAQA